MLECAASGNAGNAAQTPKQPNRQKRLTNSSEPAKLTSTTDGVRTKGQHAFGDTKQGDANRIASTSAQAQGYRSRLGKSPSRFHP
jgi:hypothetical protein